MLQRSGYILAMTSCNVYLYETVWMTNISLSSYRLTGFQVPAPVTSTGSIFSLRLTSDFAVSAHGFKIYYEGKEHNTAFNFLCYLSWVFSSEMQIAHCSGQLKVFHHISVWQQAVGVKLEKWKAMNSFINTLIITIIKGDTF